MTVRNGFARLAVASVLVAGGVTVAGGARASDEPAMAEDFGDLAYTTTQGAFDDVKLAVEDAIINRGLVIDYQGQFGKMLERTAEATGGVPVFAHAEWYQFCSSLLSQAMVEADPRNVGYCPYTVVVYELAGTPGEINVGYRRPGAAGSEASMQALGAVDVLLAEIVKEATE
jgi:hypothetical protein